MIINVFIGFFAGLISGLFASGGGMILVPLFSSILKLNEQESRATSIFAILPMVLVSSIFYLRADFVDWNIGIKCAIGGVIGGIIGSKLLNKIPENILKILFVIFLFYVSLKIIFIT